MNDTERSFISALTMLCLSGAIFFGMNTAGASEENPDVDTLIREKISNFVIQIYPHSEQCRRVYHELEETNYLICLVDGHLEATELPATHAFVEPKKGDSQ